MVVGLGTGSTAAFAVERVGIIILLLYNNQFIINILKFRYETKIR